MLFEDLNRAIKDHWKESEDWITYSTHPDKHNAFIAPFPGQTWVIHNHHADNVGNVSSGLRQYQSRDYHGFEWVTSIKIWYRSGYRVEKEGKELFQTDDLKQLLEWIIAGYDARFNRLGKRS